MILLLSLASISTAPILSVRSSLGFRYVSDFTFSFPGTYGWQIIFSLLDSPSMNVVHERKSIAIVGAGSSGMAMLKTLLDMPEHNSWNIILFEERENIGGIW